MKSVKDKEFDDLFKNQLKDTEVNSAYLEDDWDDLELMLDKPSGRRGIVFWLPILSSAAAVLIFLGWWMFRPDVSPVVKPKQPIAANTVPVNTNQASKAQKVETDVKSSTENITSQQVAANEAQPVPTSHVKENSITKPALVSGSVKANGLKNAPKYALSGQNNAPGQTNHALQSTANGVIPANTVQLPNNRDKFDFSTGETMSLTASKSAAVASIEAKLLIQKSYLPSQEVTRGKDAKAGSSTIFAKRPQFALTVLGAPEVNGIGGFADAKSGTNIGLLFSAGIFNKITISTGANYAVMPYNTNIANYHSSYSFKTNPSQIEADCRALDIPINIDYQLYNKHQNKFSIGTGLSSYIMMHESYDYYYSDPTTKGPTAYTVPNHGKYFFGIANIQATYTRQVNSKFGVSVQPYLKLPLTNIGYSQAKLQTAGVAVGLSWNINSLTKP